MELKGWALLGFVLGIISASITIFWFGFHLGSTTLEYQLDVLEDQIRFKNNKISSLQEKINLLEKSKPELQMILNNMKEHNLLFYSTSGPPVEGKRLWKTNISYHNAVSYKSLIYISFYDIFTEEKNYVTKLNFQDTYELKGKVILGFSTYNSETKYVEVKAGDTLKFIFHGETYILLISSTSLMAPLSYSRMGIEMYKIS